VQAVAPPWKTGQVRIDSSKFPLLVVQWEGGVQDGNLKQFFHAMNELVARAARERQHYAVVSDGDAAFGPVQRKLIADWLAATPTAYREWDLGSYVVIHSAAARGAVTALKWLTPRLDNLNVYPTLEAATAAAREVLARMNAR
jgi:hypothetical protein